MCACEYVQFFHENDFNYYEFELKSLGKIDSNKFFQETSEILRKTEESQ